MTTATQANPPEIDIANSHLQAKIYLPDAEHGYYRGTRFDWSGVISSLRYAGHDFYGPWFNKTDATVHDFVYREQDIVAGPCSAITGPVDEFKPLGWDEAKAGGHFIKIGVGALEKTADAAYDNYHVYKIADGGHWKVDLKKDSLQFTHELHDTSSGYGYVYRKNIRLTSDRPEMILEHHLKNTGTHAIETSVYNHNFLVLDGQMTGPDFAITVPFSISSPQLPDKQLAAIKGNGITYLKKLRDKDVVATKIEGFSKDAASHSFQIENKNSGVGMKMTGDRPLLTESLWSIRTVIAMEPFVQISIKPGEEFAWTSTYNYYKAGSH